MFEAFNLVSRRNRLCIICLQRANFSSRNLKGIWEIKITYFAHTAHFYFHPYVTANKYAIQCFVFAHSWGLAV